MLRSRIIPCLLLHQNGLVKTINFANPKYVGDPINAVKIFNEKEVDELIVLDIDATVNANPPDFDVIKKIAHECRMPLCYGGGITNKDEAIKIISLGVEKISLSNAALVNPKLCKEIAEVIGCQSVVVTIDVKKNFFGRYDIYSHNGKKKSKWKFEEFISLIESYGIGEIVINSIDNDGLMKGYDFSLIKFLRTICSVPITALGGAGSLSDIQNLISEFKIIGAAVGSLFVFKGKYRAVLITYPQKKDIIF